MLQLNRTYAEALRRHNDFYQGYCGVPPVRLRWSQHEDRWLLEQRVRRACATLDTRTEIHFKQGLASLETLRRYADGYAFLWSYTPKLTEEGFPFSTGTPRSGLISADRLLYVLRWNIHELMEHTGDVARDATLVMDAADARADARADHLKAKAHESAGELGADAWEDLCWREGRRVAVS